MKGVTLRTKQLDAEIIGCITKNGALTGYRVVQYIQAPEATVRQRLKRLVNTGRLDCYENHKARYYYLPGGVRP